MIDFGETYSTGFEVRDQAGALVNPSSFSCALTLPDGSTTAPTLTNPSTGLLRLDYLTTQAGRHAGTVTTTVGTTVKKQQFTFDVDDATPSGIVSLAEARSRLTFLSTASDEKLRSHIDAATDYVEGLIGPVVRQTITRTFTPGANGAIFFSGPVISVSSMTDTTGYGWTYSVSGYVLDTAGMLTPLYGTSYPRTGYPVTITYVAGYTVVPELIRQAALDFIDWSWQSQRGPSGAPFQGGEGEFPDLTTATPPYKIEQKLRRYMMPSLA